MPKTVADAEVRRPFIKRKAEQKLIEIKEKGSYESYEEILDTFKKQQTKDIGEMN